MTYNLHIRNEIKLSSKEQNTLKRGFYYTILIAILQTRRLIILRVDLREEIFHNKGFAFGGVFSHIKLKNARDLFHGLNADR